MKEDKSARALPEKLEREVSAAAMASTPNNAVNAATKLPTCWASASVGALFLSGNRGRAPSFASEAQASWMIFSSRRFEKLDYSIEEQYRAQPYAWTRNQIELPWS